MATLAQPRTNRKPLPPATGKIRWISKPTKECFWGRLAITVNTKRGPIETAYDLAAVTDKDGKIIGLGLAKDDDETYEIHISQPYGWECSCASSIFETRPAGFCKHCIAVRSGLSAIGIVLPVSNAGAQYISGF
jgi:hypothetical protein